MRRQQELQLQSSCSFDRRAYLDSVLDFEMGGRMGLDDTTMLYKIDSVVFYGEVNSCRLVSTHLIGGNWKDWWTRLAQFGEAGGI